MIWRMALELELKYGLGATPPVRRVGDAAATDGGQRVYATSSAASSTRSDVPQSASLTPSSTATRPPAAAALGRHQLPRARAVEGEAPSGLESAA